MEGTYPLMIDGALVGKLTVRTEGGMTVFDVCSRMLPGIVRVSVYGDGKEGYLGVLVPEEDGLGLHRRLSRAALRDFPKAIDAAERAGQGAMRSGELPMTADTPAAQETSVQPDEPACPDLPETAESPAEPMLPLSEDDRYWYASPDGALVRFDGEQNLIALPLGDERMPERGGEACVVEGKEYMVFRTRHGRLLY